MTWITGTYDPDLNLLYWGTANPNPVLSGESRPGDNLFTCTIIALNPDTGKLVWYFQTSPHDVHDWDAVQTPVLVDTVWQGQPRKLLLHANRNGFFYVLDRTNGKLLRATPLVKKLTWAKGIGEDGRPIMTPNNEPTLEGNRICPPLEGATNWFSPSFNPQTGLFYVQTLEKCAIFRKTPTEWAANVDRFRGDQVSGRGGDEHHQDDARFRQLEVVATRGDERRTGDFDGRHGHAATSLATNAPASAGAVRRATWWRSRCCVRRDTRP